ncbi:hypothetical protein PPTG_00726 [Phytophthora nicotianae INRA-310]|uniref:Uncharacterized protein n=1 Tax=Phytophthora nicotianae (strain INRA-310) TaxID=761204 RepID=W2RI84_PHYN3|nr:hypothetical protein PPTG_00726 [Phytophthora nicotianae INRA-310]ETN24364.1 hypothetical protein PPTG_00726 [Phytophthora nicotianae INRA-310]
MVKWNARSDLADFISYFEKQWLSSKFNKWQYFRSPCGFAKTNNPAETFNKMIKRDYSLHVRLKMDDITQKLLKLCRHQSVTGRDFTTATMPSSEMVSRVKKLFNASLLLVSNPNCNLNLLLADSTASDDKVVVKSIYSATDAADAKQKGDVNERRMEHFRQPCNGWVVDTGDLTASGIQVKVENTTAQQEMTKLIGEATLTDGYEGEVVVEDVEAVEGDAEDDLS